MKIFLSDNGLYSFRSLSFNFVNLTNPVPINEDSKYKFSWFSLNI